MQRYEEKNQAQTIFTGLIGFKSFPAALLSTHIATEIFIFIYI